MKNNQKGFSLIEIVLVVVVLGLLGLVGFMAYNRSQDKDTATSNNSTQATEQSDSSQQITPNSTPYTFDKLGLTMDILDGWKVNYKETQEDGVAGYHWTVGKEGVEHYIRLSSAGFVGGFYDCESAADFTRVFVRDKAPTKNSKFVLMAWSFTYSGDTTNRVSIVPAEGADFRNDDDPLAPEVKNGDIPTGNYFMCITMPQPGMDLGLVENLSANESRHDSIGVLDSKGMATSFSTDAASYTDIKTMLTSLR